MSLYTDAVKLSEAFLIYVKKFEKVDGIFNVNGNYKKNILQNARLLIYNQNNYNLMISAIIDDNIKFPEKEIINSYNISDYLKRYVRMELNENPIPVNPEELLIFGKFYFHPILQKSSAPPKFILNEKMDLVQLPSEKFFLENLESFTLTDLINYFIVKTKRSELIGNNIKHQFFQLLERYDLDLILYMIDYASKYAEEENLPAPRTPLYLTDNKNMQGALSIYYDRKNSSKEMGIDREIAND